MLGTRGSGWRRTRRASLAGALVLAVAMVGGPAAGDTVTVSAGYGGEYNRSTVTYVDGDGNATTFERISGGNLRGSALGWMGCVWDQFWEADNNGIHRTFCFTVYSITSGPDAGRLRVFLDFARDEWGEEWEQLGPLTVEPAVLSVVDDDPTVLRLVGGFPELGAVDLTLTQDSEWLSSARTNDSCRQSYNLTSRSAPTIIWTDGGGTVGGYSVHTPDPFVGSGIGLPNGRDRCAAAFVGATDGTWGDPV